MPAKSARKKSVARVPRVLRGTVYITRQVHFNAAHRLHNPAKSQAWNEKQYGLCTNPHWHGHNYVLEVTVKGQPDPDTGYIMDLGELKRILQRAILDKCKRVGMNGYLAKPVSNADLKLLFAGLAGSGARGPEAGGEHSLLDVRGSLDNLGGDLGLYREIVGMFAESAPEVMRELISALDGADAARAEQHAHNLKGMAANIGARRLAELAGIIQHGARASRPGECQAWIPRLRDELESLMAALAAAGETLGS